MNNEKKSILAIDDDTAILNLMAILLYGAGYNITTAESPSKALEILEHLTPDLILLDVQMPEMDGYELCSILQGKESLSFIPIIFLTSLKSEQSKAKALALGAVDYLTKPIGQNELFAAIEKHIKTKENWEKQFSNKEENEIQQTKDYTETEYKKYTPVETKDHTVIKDTEEYKKINVPKNFSNFKRFLFDSENINEKDREKFNNITASQLYSNLEQLDITAEKMAKYIADFMDMEYIFQIDHETIKIGVIPTNFAKKNLVVSINSDYNYSFVITNPFDMELLDNLSKFKPDKLFITQPENILDIYKDTTPKKAAIDIEQIEKKIHEEYKTRHEILDHDDHESTITMEEDVNEQQAPIIMLVNKIMENAYSMGASDIHIEPYENEVVIRYRVDGELRIVNRLKPQKLINPVVSRIKIMGSLDIADKRLPQDGRIIFKKFNRNFDFDLRVSTIPANFGERVVMRIIDKQKSVLPLTKLGFSNKNIEIYRQKIKAPYGMILHVGPTGSGKSMTLYAALNEINKPEINVLTIEDPIEYTLKGIGQVQAYKEIGLTFARALRAFLRQDPDVILVGEIRDKETANIAVEAALTGHLLLSTLHTNDAASTITRFIEMGIEPFMISSSIVLICAQRLIKVLCNHCKQPYNASPEEKVLLGINDKTDTVIYRAKGCEKCNSGYKGRTGIHELLIPNDKIKSAINHKGITAEELKDIAVNECGMTTLYEDAMAKVLHGETSIEEVLAKIKE